MIKPSLEDFLNDKNELLGRMKEYEEKWGFRITVLFLIHELNRLKENHNLTSLTIDIEDSLFYPSEREFVARVGEEYFGDVYKNPWDWV